MRIALISDIHFGYFSRTVEFSVPGEPIQDESEGGHSLESELKDLLKDYGVEYLFIAGDMTSKGSPQEFHYCEKKILDIAEFVGIPIENIIYSVGNHDIDRKISELQNSSCFDTSLPEVKSLTEAQYQFIAANAAELNIKGLFKLKNGVVPSTGVYLDSSDFIVFVLNTSLLCSASQKIPHGKLTKEQLEWFEKKAQEHIGDDRIKIVLMHHHPINYAYHVPSFDVSMIEEGSEMINIAGKYGIDIIVHGHRHHPTAITRNEDGWIHPIAFLCAGSLSVNAKHRDNGEIPNTVHILEINKADRDIILYNFKYTSAEGWTPVDNRTPAVPLDREMWLGKLPDESATEDYLKKFSTCMHVFEWNSLPKNLKYMNIENLNQKIKDFYPDHIVTGKFPENISIIPKGEI